MNTLTQVKRIQQINSREAALGISDQASWHSKYKDSAYVYVGGIPFDLTEGDLLAVFAQSSAYHPTSCNSKLQKMTSCNNLDDDEVFTFAKNIAAPYDLVMQTKQLGRLPVVKFAAGGVATPADAALMMQLGCDGVFVGSGVFKSGDPAKRAREIVQAVTHYSDPNVLADISCGIGEAMVGINLNDEKVERYANRSE